MRILRSPYAVAVLGVIITAAVAANLLAQNDWDPSALTAFGEDSPEITHYAESKLGREVVTREGLGHDGRFFFVLANDPLLLEAEDNAEILDRPRYRSQRMLYPFVAGVGGLFTPEAILWGLIVVNLVMVGLGTWTVSQLAVKLGAPALVGLAFALNPGIINEFFIDGAGVVAFGLACLGALALQNDRTVLAAVSFSAAVLTREVMLLFVAATAVLWLVRKRSIPWSWTLAPVLAAAAWFLYVRAQVAPGDGGGVIELVAVPFSGLVDAFDLGLLRPVEIVVAALVIVLAVLVPLRAVRSEVYLAWGAAGFALLVPFLSAFVWSRVWDVSRALVPLFTVYVLQVFVSRGSDTGPRSIGEATG